MNSLQKGNKGLGSAIGWFTNHGYIVNIPLNDSQKYDLVVDNGLLQKIQVKYTEAKSRNKSKNYMVSLRTIFSTTTGVTKTTTFKNSDCDFLFVVTLNYQFYLIPKSRVTQVSTLTLDNNYQDCQVG